MLLENGSLIELNDTTLTWVVQEPTSGNHTLVARKIEDMTDEEREKVMYPSQFDTKSKRMLLDGMINSGDLDADMFIQLLEMGVYPFYQSHFKSGEVIDILTKKSEE